VIKRHFFIVAAAVLMGLMVLAVVLKLTLADTGKADSPRGRGGGSQVVSQAVVTQRTFSDEIRALGAARGRRSVNITSSTTELITRVLFTDGQRVAAGTPLVELQAREEDAGIIQTRAQVAQAQREYDRYQTLADRGIAPRVAAEQARTALESAQAMLAAAEARRGDRVIRAPFAGVLGLTSVTPGTLINPGAVITTLDDISVIRVDFPVPERYLGALRPGTSIVGTVDAFDQEQFSGRIALIDTRINEQTRAVTVRAEIPNPGNRIRPGMLMRVAVSHGLRQAPAVPEAAVQYEGEGAFVYRIVSGERGLNAQRVEVGTGAVEDGFVEILSGLNPGDRLVGSGLNRIQPGAPVSLAGQAPGGAPGTARTRGAAR
jgi:membrane fusion protein (multidrug efflux system)